MFSQFLEFFLALAVNAGGTIGIIATNIAV